MKELHLQLESIVDEYRGLVSQSQVAGLGGSVVDRDRLIRRLSVEADWTSSGAERLLDLACGYGSFMLKNALALAVALGVEDGDHGF